MKTKYYTIVLVSLVGAFTFSQDNSGLKIEGRVAFTEGPAWHAASENVYFTDIENNRIMRRDPLGKTHVYRTPSGRANGLTFDKEGRLLACEGGGEGGNRRITRTELDGTITVLTDRFEGKRYNSPNDLTIDSEDRIYFTDPRYGDRSDMEIKDHNDRPVEGVFRLDPDGSVNLLIYHEVDRPNGIGISADGKYLFVADNANDRKGQNRKLWRFELLPNGDVDLKTRKELFDWGSDRGPDGLCIGPDGKLYVTAGFNFPDLPAQTSDKYKAGVYIIDPDGGLDRFIPIPADMITNCTFGGTDGKTLFITAGAFLWSIPVDW